MTVVVFCRFLLIFARKKQNKHGKQGFNPYTT